jgi:uncharacterized iron-regulated membrane protein
VSVAFPISPNITRILLRPNAFRRGLQTIHLWLGIILAIPFIAIGLTGSILLFQREADILMVPQPTAVGERQKLDAIIEAAKAAAPEGMRMGRVEFREGFPATFQFQTGGRPNRSATVYVDPVSLEIMGPPVPVERGAVMRSIQSLHEFLWLPPRYGLRVTGYVGVVLTFMGISGLYLWWPRGAGWRNAFTIRKGARGFVLNRDLHHVVGFWGSSVFLILCISGIYLTLPETFNAAVSTFLPGGSYQLVEPAPGFVASQGPVDADGAVAIAKSAVPDATPIGIQPPEQPGRPIIVYMEPNGFEPAIPPIMVTINPETAELGFIDNPSTYSVRDQFLNWNYALHFAVGLPMAWKVIVFFSGFLPLILAVTGFLIWWLRRQARQAVRESVPDGVTQAAE